MDYRNPGLTARMSSKSMTGVVRRDPDRSTNVAHLKTNEPAQYEIQGAQKQTYPELNWNDFFNYASIELKLGRPINVTIVAWDNGDRANTGDFAPVDFDNGEITMISGLFSLDPTTKTFTVTNELCRAGEGMSGGIALLNIGNDIFEIGQLHGIVDGKQGRQDQLRFVRSDSSDIESFSNDIETNHKRKKKSTGNKSSRHDHGVQINTINRQAAELKADKSTAGKNQLKQRYLREERRAAKNTAREKRK